MLAFSLDFFVLLKIMNHTEHPFYGPFFCSMGITYAMVLTAAGSAYGTAKAGKTIAAIAVSRPDLIMKSIISGK